MLQPDTAEVTCLVVALFSFFVLQFCLSVRLSEVENWEGTPSEKGIIFNFSCRSAVRLIAHANSVLNSLAISWSCKLGPE